MEKCNRDCFNCPYPDCINDEMTAEDYQEALQRDRVTLNSNEKLKLNEKKRAYYAENRERRLAWQRDYYQANRDHIRAMRKAHYYANRAEELTKRKASSAAARILPGKQRTSRRISKNVAAGTPR